MERPTPPARLRMSLLAERYYEEAPRCPVVCRLWRMRPDLPVEGTAVYAMGMESPSGRYLYCVGEDETAARGLFERITAGRLSPLHLGDVVEDFLWEQSHPGKERLRCRFLLRWCLGWWERYLRVPALYSRRKPK